MCEGLRAAAYLIFKYLLSRFLSSAMLTLRIALAFMAYRHDRDEWECPRRPRQS